MPSDRTTISALRTALMIALHNGHKDIAQLLQNYGAVCFKETENNRTVEISKDSFFADGINFPLSDIWGSRGVFYTMSGNAKASLAAGVGDTAYRASGCFLYPIMFICALGLIVVFLAHGSAGAPIGESGGLIFTMVSIIAGGLFLRAVIAKGTKETVLSCATKTFYLLILSKQGEHKLLEGMSDSFLLKVNECLNVVLEARRKT